MGRYDLLTGRIPRRTELPNQCETCGYMRRALEADEERLRRMRSSDRNVVYTPDASDRRLPFNILEEETK